MISDNQQRALRVPNHSEHPSDRIPVMHREVIRLGNARLPTLHPALETYFAAGRGVRLTRRRITVPERLNGHNSDPFRFQPRIHPLSTLQDAESALGAIKGNNNIAKTCLANGDKETRNGAPADDGISRGPEVRLSQSPSQVPAKNEQVGPERLSAMHDFNPRDSSAYPPTVIRNALWGARTGHHLEDLHLAINDLGDVCCPGDGMRSSGRIVSCGENPTAYHGTTVGPLA